MTMPGVGAIVALTYRAGIDQPERFKSSRQLGPCFGLTPDAIKAARPTAAAPSAEPVMLPFASLCSKRHT
jgi:hypothetical protein